MLKVALTAFCLVFLPYLFFVLPHRIRRAGPARVRFAIFLAVVTAGILVFLKKML